MTPEERTARAQKAGQTAAANRRIRTAALAKRLADQEATDARTKRGHRAMASGRALGERMMEAAPVADPVSAAVPESVRWAMAAAMLDPPFVASPEGNRERMKVFDRALAEGARLGWTLKQ